MSLPLLLALALAWVLLARHRRPQAARPVPVEGRAGRGEARAASPAPPGALRGRWALVAQLGFAAALTALFGVLAGGAVLAIPALVRWRGQRRRRRAADTAVVDQVPEVIDLFTLALGAGLTVSESIGVVGRRAPGPVGDALARASVAVTQGAPVGDALDAARERCGPAAMGLLSALAGGARHGTPLAPVLDRLGQDARLDRRRSAEERARRVPVQLLFPLVLCVLPAFGLLTVVPLLVNSLGALA